MVNSVDPDQTAPSGAVIWVCTVYLAPFPDNLWSTFCKFTIHSQVFFFSASKYDQEMPQLQTVNQHIFVLSIFEWPFYTGFTVPSRCQTIQT